MLIIFCGPLMGSHNLKIVSLNVNWLGNPIKRSRVMKREKMQVILLQETHMCNLEHTKLKKFGYSQTFFSSYKNSRRRGVAILISNSVNFELIKEIGDKEGRYIISGKALSLHTIGFLFFISTYGIFLPPFFGTL